MFLLVFFLPWFPQVRASLSRGPSRNPAPQCYDLSSPPGTTRADRGRSLGPQGTRQDLGRNSSTNTAGGAFLRPKKTHLPRLMCKILAARVVSFRARDDRRCGSFFFVVFVCMVKSRIGEQRHAHVDVTLTRRRHERWHSRYLHVWGLKGWAIG